MLVRAIALDKLTWGIFSVNFIGERVIGMLKSFGQLLLVLLPIVGCEAKEKSSGGSSPSLNTTTKCEFESSQTTVKSCFEYTNLTEANFTVASGACTEAKGSFTAKVACSRTNNVGGCTQGGNVGKDSIGKLVFYFYSPGMTVDQVKRSCSDQNEQYVPP